MKQKLGWGRAGFGAGPWALTINSGGKSDHSQGEQLICWFLFFIPCLSPRKEPITICLTSSFSCTYNDEGRHCMRLLTEHPVAWRLCTLTHIIFCPCSNSVRYLAFYVLVYEWENWSPQRLGIFVSFWAKDSNVVLTGFNFRFCAIWGHPPVLLSCHEPHASLGTGAAPISKTWFLPSRSSRTNQHMLSRILDCWDLIRLPETGSYLREDTTKRLTACLHGGTEWDVLG